MKLIVGLGNPGEKYQNTRHNMGFMVVEKFFQEYEPIDKTVWDDSKKFKGDIAQIEWQRRSPSKAGSGQALLEKIILAKPKTYMNNSGLAVLIISQFFKINPDDIWIVHDEIDLPLGFMKIRNGGASAGHRGVESIIKSLGTDKFWRFRLGIGNDERIKTKTQKQKHIDDFVLEDFTSNEKRKVKDLIKRGVKAISFGLENGLEKAMNRFNTR
ncbi:MAG: aminoacyl-tRNA hydrolase [Patescibacteria group bacterium]|nr:aminoacyl-tRNA hydrolase [Patescibacteria group bacterium]